MMRVRVRVGVRFRAAVASLSHKFEFVREFLFLTPVLSKRLQGSWLEKVSTRRRRLYLKM